MTIQFLIAAFLSYGQLNSCEDKLMRKIWPLDCMLALQLKKFPKDHKVYEKLNLWCQTYEEELSSKPPPKALFSLYMPQTCLKIARKAQKDFEDIKILDGTFLRPHI